MTTSLPFHSEQLELTTLANLFGSPLEAAAEFMGLCQDPGRLFYDDRHRCIVEAITSLVDKGRTPGLDSVVEKLRSENKLADAGAGGEVYVRSIPIHATQHLNLPNNFEDLRAYFTARQLVAECTRTIHGLERPSDADLCLEDHLRRVSDIHLESAGSEVGIKALVRGAIDQFETAISNRGQLQGIPTGFYDLDKRTHGLKPGQMIVIAARPSCGKTSLAMNIAERVAVDCGISTGIFSLEMSREELVFRLLCARARVASDDAQGGNLNEHDIAKLSTASGAIARAPLHIDDAGGLTIAQLRARARRMVIRHKVQLIIVDYLQLMRGRRSENRNAEVSEISNGIKALAKELRLPIVALSQLNRDVEKSDKPRKPRLSDLRDSGSVEQDADLVLMIHSESKADEDVKPCSLIIAKHRNGPIGTIPITFLRKFTRFESGAKVHE